MFCFLLIWQAATTFGPLVGGSLPTALQAIWSLGDILAEPDTWAAIGKTVYMALTGLAISICLGIPVGVLIGLSSVAFKSSKLVFDFFKVIPPIVIIPIVILVFGPTAEMGIFLVVFATFFMLAAQAAYGVRDTDPVLLDTMKCYGLGKFDQIIYARIPGALPFIAIGIRISVAASMIVAVVAGLIGGAPSLGREMLLYQSSGQPGKTFATVLVFGLLGLAFARSWSFLERKMIFWTAA